MSVLVIDLVVPCYTNRLCSWEQYESDVFHVSSFLNCCMS